MTQRQRTPCGLSRSKKKPGHLDEAVTGLRIRPSVARLLQQRRAGDLDTHTGVRTDEVHTRCCRRTLVVSAIPCEPVVTRAKRLLIREHANPYISDRKDLRLTRILLLLWAFFWPFLEQGLGLDFYATCLDGDLHSIFHWILKWHLDSEQAVLVVRFGFVRFHRPT